VATRKRTQTRGRSKRKSRGFRFLVAGALALLIAGFVVRRALVPEALHRLAYRPAPVPAGQQPPIERRLRRSVPEAQPSTRSQPLAQAEAPPSQATQVQPHAVPRSSNLPSENLSSRDRQELDDVLKRKTK